MARRCLFVVAMVEFAGGAATRLRGLRRDLFELFVRQHGDRTFKTTGDRRCESDLVRKLESAVR
jgi:hypothetical protein